MNQDRTGAVPASGKFNQVGDLVSGWPDKAARGITDVVEFQPQDLAGTD
jgi:hypothetical protein